MKSNVRIRGNVRIVVRDKFGNVKNYPKSLFRRMFNLPPKKMIVKKHNTITRQGDALIADLLLETPTQTKINSVTGYMQVGTGWTGNSAKQNTRCNTPVGSFKKIDISYPQLQASFGNVGDTTVTYKTTFAVGDLNASGIDEVCLLNGNTSSARSFAYAQVSPAVSVTSQDTLSIEWEITVLGS